MNRKKQYNLIMSTVLLDKLKELAIENETTVSHEIRQAVIKHLKK